MGMGDQRHAPAALSPGKRRAMPILYETGWASGPICTGVEYIAPTGIRSPDRPTCSEFLYLLRYPGPHGNNPSKSKFHS